jgi:opacity protein-like surface antigen
MPIFAIRWGFVFAVAAFGLGEQPAHAQSAPVSYWNPGWLGFGGNLNAGQDASAGGSVSAPRASGFFATSTNFRGDWFNQRGMGLGTGFGVSVIGATGAFGSFESQGAQFGYTLQNSPVTVYAGFDTLKYKPGFGSAFSPFDTTSVSGYAANAGIEFKPTSNVSLSLGVGYQQSGRSDTDTTSSSSSSFSQYDLVRGRR